MFTRLPAFVLGYHGCDRDVAERVLTGVDELRPSENTYDWLGHGIYFWENNPERALTFAHESHARAVSAGRKRTRPAVVGAVIDLGQCLDLLDSSNLSLLQDFYKLLAKAMEKNGMPMPENRSGMGTDSDLVLRHLDCAVIETLHEYCREHKLPEADSVRGVFVEGDELYPNSGFREKNHIQICVRRTRCIRGYFRVREPALR
jgi:hypothetical protein